MGGRAVYRVCTYISLFRVLYMCTRKLDQFDAGELGGFVEYDSASGNLFVVTTGGSTDVASTGSLVATLANIPADVMIIVDDGSGVTGAVIV